MNPADFYDLIAKDYDREGGTLWAAENHVLQGILFGRRALRPPLLDVGCGTGLLLEFLQRARAMPLPTDYLGLDISHGMLAEATRKFPQHRFQHLDMDILSLDHPKPQYHAVVSLFGAFSYARQPLRVLRALFLRMQPGGRLVVMAFGLRYAIRPSYMANARGVDVPATYYAPADLADMATAAGFRKVRVSGMTSPWLERRAPRMSVRALTMALAAEHLTVGCWQPDRCYHQILEAVR